MGSFFFRGYSEFCWISSGVSQILQSLGRKTYQRSSTGGGGGGGVNAMAQSHLFKSITDRTEEEDGVLWGKWTTTN